MLNIIYNGNLDTTNRQIQALQAIMPLEKDSEIHEDDLKKLRAHKERLMSK